MTLTHHYGAQWRLLTTKEEEEEEEEEKKRGAGRGTAIYRALLKACHASTKRIRDMGMRVTQLLFRLD
jgi:hypothetical protein